MSQTTLYFKSSWDTDWTYIFLIWLSNPRGLKASDESCDPPTTSTHNMGDQLQCWFPNSIDIYKHLLLYNTASISSILHIYLSYAYIMYIYISIQSIISWSYIDIYNHLLFYNTASIRPFFTSTFPIHTLYIYIYTVNHSKLIHTCVSCLPMPARYFAQIYAYTTSPILAIHYTSCRIAILCLHTWHALFLGLYICSELTSLQCLAEYCLKSFFDQFFAN